MLLTVKSGISEEPIEVTLVSNQSSIVPGQSFYVGISQNMRKGFHTYYKNPGKIGLATNVKWELPEGFKAGPLIWPTPQITTMSFYTVWGYDDSALLLTKIEAPESLKVDTEIKLHARVTYMCCSTTCHPGASECSISFKVKLYTQIDKDWNQKFNQVLDQQAIQSQEWSSQCKREQENYIITLSYLGKNEMPHLKDLMLFTDERLTDSNIPIRVKREKLNYSISAKAEKFLGVPPSIMKGILTSSSIFENKKSVIEVNCNIEGQVDSFLP